MLGWACLIWAFSRLAHWPLETRSPGAMISGQALAQSWGVVITQPLALRQLRKNWPKISRACSSWRCRSGMGVARGIGIDIDSREQHSVPIRRRPLVQTAQKSHKPAIDLLQSWLQRGVTEASGRRLVAVSPYLAAAAPLLLAANELRRPVRQTPAPPQGTAAALLPAGRARS